MAPIKISYFSDILCIWAYAAQIRLEQVVKDFGDKVAIDARFCSVFADAHGKIESQWKNKGGYEGFNQHLLDVATHFPHITVNDRIWLDVRPLTSASGHMFVKAVHLIEEEDRDASETPPYLDTLMNKASWALRCAFFEHGEDISDWKVHHHIADQLGMDYSRIEEKIRSSEAVAQLAVDYQVSDKFQVEGSPTLVMNEGRQKLFGNVGYRLIEANIEELIRTPDSNEASWC